MITNMRKIYLLCASIIISLFATTFLPIPIMDTWLLAAQPQQLEAEQAVLQGKVKIARNHPGFTGTGFADYTGEGTIKWSFNVPEHALYQLEFRYALAKGSGERPLNIRSQGVLIKSGVSFPETRSFDEWRTFAIFVRLDAGHNTIEASTTGQSGPNIDHLLVSLTPPDENKFLTFPLHSSHAIFEGSAEQAEAYYKTLDPLDRKTTFENWKHQNDFDSCTSPDCTHTVYFNGLDLGFGRSVFVKVLPNGDVVSYLQNYPSLEEAIQGKNLLATVTMEYSRPVDQSGQAIENAPKFTKFYAFDAAGKRINKVDLDGRGPQFLPGLCNVCHGGKPKQADLADKNYFDRGDTGGEWIAWDLDTFEYHPNLNRAMQEDKFKKLNEAVLLTDPPGAVRLLIDGWYGGEDLPNPTFDGSFVPPGWKEDGADVEKLYREVVARSCRTCHNQRGSYNNSGHSILDGPKELTLEFSSFTDFNLYKKEIESLVYEQAFMPLAKRTFDRFWRSEQPKVLDDVLFNGKAHQNPPPEVYPGAARFAFGDLRRPGRPISKIAGSRLGFVAFPFSVYFLNEVQEGRRVRLNGAASVFASEFFWSFDDVPGTTVPPLTGADNPQTSFDLDPNASSDILDQNRKPYMIRFGVTNEFAGFNEIIRGQLFSDKRLQSLTFTEDIYELLTTNFSSTRDSTDLSCIHCHSNSNIVSHANSIFKLLDFGISGDEARRRYAYHAMLTRINFRDPGNSLILKKPSGELPHFGGRFFVFSGSNSGLDNTGDRDAKARILRWIMEGAPYDDVIVHVVNDLVDFTPIESTFQTSSDARGCPFGFVGKFSFDAKLANKSSNQPLSNLRVQVTKLTNGNLLHNADEGDGGEGAILTIPLDDILNPGEFVNVHFIICLKEEGPFSFFVDVLGSQEAEKTESLQVAGPQSTSTESKRAKFRKRSRIHGKGFFGRFRPGISKN